MTSSTTGALDCTGITVRDREILAFERDWWRGGEGRETAIRERLGLAPADYHLALSRIIDRDEALAHDPLLVRRLRRQRTARRQQRSTRRA